MSDVRAPEAGETTTFGGLVELVREKYVPHSATDDLPCVNLEDIPEGCGRVVSWSKASENLSTKTKFAPGDILFGKLRPYLRKFAQPNFAGVCTSELLAFRAREGVDPRFAYQIVTSLGFIDHCVASSFGTKMPRTNWSTAAAYPVVLPLPSEQRRVADLLSAVDEGIESLEAQAAKETERAQGLLQALLPEGFDVVNSPVSSLGDALISIEGGKSFMCSDTPASEGAWGVLKVSAVRPDGFASIENKLVENLALVNRKYEVKEGDLLITRANTPELVGAACYVKSPQRKLLLCDKTLRLLPQPEAMAQYLWLWLQTAVARRHVEAHATGTSAGMKNISQDSIRRIPLSLPSLDLQRLRVAPITAQLEYVAALKAEAAKQRLKKFGLLQALLKGGKARAT
jgi:type I restriction enzyme, S subunit